MKKSPFFVPTLFLICLLTNCLKSNGQTASEFNHRGVDLYNKRNLEEALIEFQKALYVDPTYIDAIGNVASVLNELGRPNEALKAAEKALVIQPYNADYLSQKAQALASLNNYNAALEALEQISESEISSDVLLLEGLYLSQLSKYREAISKLSQIDYREPDVIVGQAEMLKALSYAMLGELKPAMKSIEVSIALYPLNPKAYYIKAGIHERMGDMEAALTAAAKAAELNTKVSRGKIFIPLDKTKNE